MLHKQLKFSIAFSTIIYTESAFQIQMIYDFPFSFKDLVTILVYMYMYIFCWLPLLVFWDQVTLLAILLSFLYAMSLYIFNVWESIFNCETCVKLWWDAMWMLLVIICTCVCVCTNLLPFDHNPTEMNKSKYMIIIKHIHMFFSNDCCYMVYLFTLNL